MSTRTVRIADKVRGIAAEHRMTQQRMAQVLELSRTSIVERLNGRVPFNSTELLTLAEVLDVPIHRFFPASTPSITPAADSPQSAAGAFPVGGAA